jgi:hypothetical protein
MSRVIDPRRKKKTDVEALDPDKGEDPVKK